MVDYLRMTTDISDSLFNQIISATQPVYLYHHGCIGFGNDNDVMSLLCREGHLKYLPSSNTFKILFLGQITNSTQAYAFGIG